MSNSQNNHSEGDHRSEKNESKAERVEAKAENRERGEASKHIADGDLNKDIQASTLEKRLSRKSGATGYGVASADSLLPTEAEIQKMGKQLTAQLEQEKPLAVIAQNIGDNNPFHPQAPQVMTDATNATPDNLLSSYGRDNVMVQGFSFPNPVEAYKKEVEHHYRGKELAAMDKEIPAKAWDDAYKAFPELKQLGEKDTTRLMKAIIANELDHYGKEDLAQDEIAKTGHGGDILHKYSVGFAQIKPDGLRTMAKELDGEVQAGKRVSNPLDRFAKMDKDQLANELANPANTPLFVAAHMAHDLHMLNNHTKDLDVTPVALGYEYNADRVYAKSDSKHEHLLNKKDAEAKHIPYNSALPTDAVLQKSEHAANIREWLKKVQ